MELLILIIIWVVGILRELSLATVLTWIITGLGWLTSIFVWMHVSIFCHEMGHFLFGKIAGMSPYLIKIGNGAKISRPWLFNSRIEWGVFPDGGMTFANFPQMGSQSSTSLLKVRFLIYIIGGVCANTALFLTTNYLYESTNISMFRVFSWIEMIAIIFTLLPVNSEIYGAEFPTDGKSILNTLGTDFQKLYADISTSYQASVYRYEMNPEESRPLFNNDVRILQSLMIANQKLSEQKFSEAVTLFNQLLSMENLSVPERVYVLDSLSCIVINYRQKQYLSQADSWTKEALSIAGNSKTIQGTRGAILVELGQYVEGKELLLPLTQPGNERLDIAISSCYLAKADFHLGNSEQARQWLHQADALCSEWQWLRPLYDEILQTLQAEVWQTWKQGDSAAPC